MARMQSPSTTRTSFKVDEDLLDQLDDVAEAEGFDSRSEKLRDMVRDEVGAGAGERDEFVPESDVNEAVYRAAVRHAKKPRHVLRFDLFQSQIAQDAGISTDTVRSILHVLQGAGYVRLQAGHPGDRTTMESWLVKPLCADPRQWKHRKRV